MKISISLPNELVAWLKSRKKDTGVPVSVQIARAVAAAKARNTR